MCAGGDHSDAQAHRRQNFGERMQDAGCRLPKVYDRALPGSGAWLWIALPRRLWHLDVAHREGDLSLDVSDNFVQRGDQALSRCGMSGRLVTVSQLFLNHRTALN